MGLFDFFRRLLFGSPAPVDLPVASGVRPAVESREPPSSPTMVAPPARPIVSPSAPSSPRRVRRKRRRVDQPPVLLTRLRYQSTLVPTSEKLERAAESPYKFSLRNISPRTGKNHGFLDYSQDVDERWLQYYGLPTLRTPQDLADFLGISLGRLAWLTQRRFGGRQPPSTREAHYHYQWLSKRSGGHRLIEAPKQLLKAVQTQILRDILDRVPPHSAAHGFVEGRSIVTNARPHIGQRFLLKFDLQDFYPSVTYRRVVAIFRSLGFSREVSIWLGRLTTTAVPREFPGPDHRPGWHHSLRPYRVQHLPQGAPTSPALANLSAYSLDVRLSGLAAKYHLNFTRYADDLTFSGEARVLPALIEFIPLTQQIIKSERFLVHRTKRKVLRNNQRQSVTGVVVNQRPNVSRHEYDRLKATLHNCRKHGPSTQNHAANEHFADHLRGRIAHVMQLNPERGQKLLAMFQAIDWRR